MTPKAEIPKKKGMKIYIGKNGDGLTQAQRNEIAQGKAEHRIYVETNNLPTEKESYDAKIIQAIVNMDN
ncbi:hypothetical protein KBD75_01825 [Candidatus Woesebacteria bacterium]|nr:hypothetical protein [Candidatus Woesebacteria bacterium]